MAGPPWALARMNPLRSTAWVCGVSGRVRQGVLRRLREEGAGGPPVRGRPQLIVGRRMETLGGGGGRNKHTNWLVPINRPSDASACDGRRPCVTVLWWQPAYIPPPHRVHVFVEQWTVK